MRDSTYNIIDTRLGTMQYVPFLPKNIIILFLSLLSSLLSKERRKIKESVKKSGRILFDQPSICIREEVGRGSPYIRSEEKERERRKLVSRGREKTAFVADGRNVGPFLARRIRVKVSVPWRR